MAKKKEEKGPSTQSTGTQGVKAVGVNHGNKSQGYVSYKTTSRDQGQTPGLKLNIVGVPGATIPPEPWSIIPDGGAQVQQPQPSTPRQVNYAPGFTDVAGSPSYQHMGQQAPATQPQQAAVAPSQPQVSPQQATPAPQAANPQTAQHVQPQTATNVQQNPVVQPIQNATTVTTAQPFQAGQQIALPNGKTITLQQPQQQQPAAVNISGVGTVQAPVAQPAATAVPQRSAEPTAAERNAQYEQQKAQEAQKQQYNQAVDEYVKAGGNPNAIRQHSDPHMERMQPTAEQKQKADEYAKSQAAKGDEDEYVKTLKEYLDSKYESKEDREAREKREARQRRWAAISEGIANVFNVGGAVAGAEPAQWKSGVGALYANQEAEADKRRAEYREALKDLINYRTAIRNGDIAQARAIEEKRRNDYLEQKVLADIASKEQASRIAQERYENNEKRAQTRAEDQHRAANTKEELDRQKLANGGKAPSSSSKSGSSRGGRRRRSSSGSRATGAAAAKSAKAAAKRRAAAAARGTKYT